MTIDRKIIIIVVVLLADIILAWFLVVPQYNQFKNLQTEAVLKEAEYNAKYAYYAQVNQLFDDIQKRQDSLSKIDNALPSSLSLSPIVYFLQKKTAESGLVLKDIFFSKTSPINPKTQVKEIVFSLSLMGNYQALKNFIAILEKSANLFEVNSISFSSQAQIQQAQQSTQSHSFIMEIKTYSY